MIFVSLFAILSWYTFNNTFLYYFQVIIMLLSNMRDGNIINYVNYYFAVSCSSYRSVAPPTNVIQPVTVWPVNLIIIIITR